MRPWRRPGSILVWLAIAVLGCGNVTMEVPANVVDASRPDSSEPDASPTDATAPDASAPDASPPDASPPDASPPDAAVPTHDGAWTGTTSQAKPLSFVVVNNGITTLTVEFAVPACGVAGRTTTTFGSPVPISASGTFAANVGGVPLSYAISGTLGTTTGTGTITFNFSQPFPPVCTGSATATWSVVLSGQ
jgi:hypothetical protein